MRVSRAITTLYRITSGFHTALPFLPLLKKKKKLILFSSPFPWMEIPLDKPLSVNKENPVNSPSDYQPRNYLFTVIIIIIKTNIFYDLTHLISISKKIPIDSILSFPNLIDFNSSNSRPHPFVGTKPNHSSHSRKPRLFLILLLIEFNEQRSDKLSRSRHSYFSTPIVYVYIYIYFVYCFHA